MRVKICPFTLIWPNQWENGQINGKGQILTPTAPKLLTGKWFWWNLNLRTISCRPPSTRNIISVRRCGWSRRIPSLTEKTISGVCVSPGSAQTLVRRGGLTNHHSIPYSQQHLWCQKLPKSVYVHWSYNEQRRCCFLRHSTFTEWSSRLEEKRSCTLMVTVDIWSCVMGSNCYKSLQVVKWHQQYC